MSIPTKMQLTSQRISLNCTFLRNAEDIAKVYTVEG
jgi:hypothetical protein